MNAGVSGETSSGLLDRLDWLQRGTFQMSGARDRGERRTSRHSSRRRCASNLETALDRLKAKRARRARVLVQMEALPNLGPKYAADFHAVYPDVAKGEGVTLLPFLLDGVAGHRELNQSDGVHPNYVGERIVREQSVAVAQAGARLGTAA